ncbi:hypothetical protein OJF2_49210 [Aquisphaera giovannonii]|uniref:SLA1 homology domain-containing protein n=1 Tax=Aquisphaera giovannonii TaxID=406548 RepID=A0A5B9W910_9BACT|nr:hypothetical protein [Aquisphaera giovannonii]QEH36360.1 hypothetical protein OJF2_49210 [Aquisphaera giovannonii]
MQHRLLAVLAYAATALATCPVARGESPDPAALVRQVREREAWVERVDSLRIRAIQDWELTPKGLEHRRRAARKQFPGSPPEQDPNTRPRHRTVVEQAFDRKRIRLRVKDEGYSDDLRIWDGSRFVLQNRYDPWPGLAPDQEGSLISEDPGRWLYWLVWTNFACFRGGPHVFWWHGPKERAEIERMAAKPEDFAYEGKADFHGIPCHVVSHWGSWTTLFVGVDDGRLHGIRSGASSSRKFKRSLVELLREAGRQVADERDLERQAPTFTAAESGRLQRLGAARMTRLIDPVFEYRLSLNKEVAPGCVLPLVQETRFFEVDDDGVAFEAQKEETRIVEVKVNEPLPDSLFAVTFREGEWITDQTIDPPVRYRHKAAMTREEWSRIVEEARTKARKKPAGR